MDLLCYFGEKMIVKKTLVVVVMFIGCSENRNDMMTKLVNEKKITEDSINTYENYEAYYMQQAKDSRMNNSDTTKWKIYVDSSTFFYGRGHALKEKLKEVDFSIDSLSKRK